MRIEPWHVFVGAFSLIAVMGFLARRHLALPTAETEMAAYPSEETEGELPMQKSPIFKLDY